MTKVYLVIHSSGEYDDYHEYISAAYFNKQKADEVVEIYNHKLAIDKEQYKKCMRCRVYDICTETEESQREFIQSMKKECLISNISIDDEGFINCKSEVASWVDDEFDAKIRELEVE